MPCSPESIFIKTNIINTKVSFRFFLAILMPNCDTSDPPGHIRLNSKVIKGGYDAQRSKRGTKA
jgi:hypothetical protein